MNSPKITRDSHENDKEERKKEPNETEIMPGEAENSPNVTITKLKEGSKHVSWETRRRWYQKEYQTTKKNSWKV